MFNEDTTFIQKDYQRQTLLQVLLAWAVSTHTTAWAPTLTVLIVGVIASLVTTWKTEIAKVHVVTHVVIHVDIADVTLVTIWCKLKHVVVHFCRLCMYKYNSVCQNLLCQIFEYRCFCFKYPHLHKYEEWLFPRAVPQLRMDACT